jgi:hypothetical protein
MRTEVIICDVCKRLGVSTERYVIARGGRATTVDLCEDDAQPLEHIIEHPDVPPLSPATMRQLAQSGEDTEPDTEEPAPPAPRKRTASTRKAPAKKAATKKTAAKKSARTGSRRGTVRVTTMEEIQQMKAREGREE